MCRLFAVSLITILSIVASTTGSTALGADEPGTIVMMNVRLYTGAVPPNENGLLVIRNGKVVYAGPGKDVEIKVPDKGLDLAVVRRNCEGIQAHRGYPRSYRGE